MIIQCWFPTLQATDCPPRYSCISQDFLPVWSSPRKREKAQICTNLSRSPKRIFCLADPCHLGLSEQWTCKINQEEHAKSIKITKTHFLLTLSIWAWVNIQPDLRISLLSQCECLNSFWDISNSSLDVLSDCCISLPDHDLTYFCEINFWKLKYVGKTLRLWHLVDMVVGGKETVSWRRGDWLGDSGIVSGDSRMASAGVQRVYLLSWIPSPISRRLCTGLHLSWPCLLVSMVQYTIT